MEIVSEKKKAKTGGKTTAKLQLRGKTLQGKAIKKKAAVSTSTKSKPGKKNTTKATPAKKPTVTKKKVGSGKFLSATKLNELAKATGNPGGLRRSERK